MKIRTENITLDGTDMTSNINSNVIWLGHIVNYAIQVAFNGTPNGTLKLQASVDPINKNNPAQSSITNWTDVSGSSQAITAAGSHMWNVENAGYTFVRLVWTDSTTSTASITSARIMVKGV